MALLYAQHQHPSVTETGISITKDGITAYGMVTWFVAILAFVVVMYVIKLKYGKRIIGRAKNTANKVQGYVKKKRAAGKEYKLRKAARKRK